jgi:hypothetical protein
MLATGRFKVQRVLPIFTDGQAHRTYAAVFLQPRAPRLCELRAPPATRSRSSRNVRWAEGGVVQELSMAACSGVLCARLDSRAVQ